MKPWRKLSEWVVHDGFRRVVSRTFVLPNGETAEFEVYDERDSVVVLARAEPFILLVRQFRPGPEDVLIELPGGQVEDGQTPIEAARYELLEETGYAGELTHVGTMFRDGYATRKKHVFVAEACELVSSPARPELTETVFMSPQQLRLHLRAGRLTDVDAGYRALDHLGLL